MYSDKEIKFYVAKTETRSGQCLEVRSNLGQNFEISIPLDYNKEESFIVDVIRISLTSFFKCIEREVDNDRGVKFHTKFYLNKEYSILGDILYYGESNSVKTKFFHEITNLELRKPLTEKDTQMFFLALLMIPTFEK
jgi:hypothetical protein